MSMTHKEIERHIGEIFPTLEKKYHLDKDKSMAIMHELTEALSKALEAEEYQTILQDVNTAWQLLKKYRSTPTYSVYFDTFAHAVWKLSAETEGQRKMRRYLTAAFAAAVRHAESTQEPLTERQVEALESCLTSLLLPEVSSETLDKCEQTLRKAGFDPMISLGKRSKAFVDSIIAEEDEQIF